MYNHVNQQKRNTTDSWLEGEEIRQRACGEPEESQAPLLLPRKFPLWPRVKCRLAVERWGCLSSVPGAGVL